MREDLTVLHFIIFVATSEKWIMEAPCCVDELKINYLIKLTKDNGTCGTFNLFIDQQELQKMGKK